MRYVPRRNPLAYPAGRRPGYDPTHLAAVGTLGLSTVATSQGFLDVVRGSPASPTGITSGIDGVLGPTANNINSVGGYAFFANRPALVEQHFVFGCIISATGGSSDELIFCSDTSGGGGWAFDVAGASQFAILCQGVNFLGTGITIAAWAPYFIGVTQSDAIYAVVKRLDTGVVSTFSVAARTPFASNGAYFTGDGFFNGTSYNVKLAAMMYMVGGGGLSPTRLLKWADDPWSFWYPQRRPYLAGSTNALRQKHFRYRTDTGAVDSTPTWGAAEDAQ